MMRAMETVLGGISGDHRQQENAHRIASLSMRLGGLGDSVCGEDGSRGFLGVVGGRAPHDLQQTP